MCDQRLKLTVLPPTTVAGKYLRSSATEILLARPRMDPRIVDFQGALSAGANRTANRVRAEFREHSLSCIFGLHTGLGLAWLRFTLISRR